jgi:3-hydroxypropionate dehydrogenase (NADP+)
MNNIKNITCIGAGLIGRGWATVFSSRGYAVRLHDRDESVLEKALRQIKLNLLFLEANDLLNSGQADTAVKR